VSKPYLVSDSSIEGGRDASRAAPKDRSNTGGDDGGTIPPMDTTARLDRVEARLDGVEKRLDRVEVKLDHLGGEVSNLKWWLLGTTATVILTVIATVVGTGIGIQQMTVTTFQAALAQPTATQQPTVIVVPSPAAQPAPAASK
jgi:hypothetical protein